MRKEVKIGVFVIVALLASFFTIEFLKGKNIFTTNKSLYALYDRVDGLDGSTYVTLKGFRIGKISDVRYSKKTGNYLVEISVKKEFDIPVNSVMEVYSSDLLGTKAVDILLGDAETVCSSGDTLTGRIREDMISMLVSEMLPLKNNIDSLVLNMNTLVSSVNRIVGPGTDREIEAILRGIRRSVNDISSIASSLKGKTPEIERTIDCLSTLTASLNASSASISTAISNVEAVSEDIRKSELTEAISSLKSLIDSIQDPEGSVGKLITSDTLYNSITSLSENLNALIQAIEKNPKKYLKISVF